jgi:hypothetical protein
MECSKWINNMLGNVKTATLSTYNLFGFNKNGYRYLGGCQYRFNRRFDLAAIFPRLVYAATYTGAGPERFYALRKKSITQLILCYFLKQPVCELTELH